ncbi:hypothetical protein KUTeg_023627 [Tegillarca granosa]|uniref:Uncharacterized protein n=1 Tax=Tegillarca granosa TaxID=220873 RepID=A0ABQ9E6R8_TEGGR|nr:hypothetical protein KUTeg_023627 [Tegillarca granosa]
MHTCLMKMADIVEKASCHSPAAQINCDVGLSPPSSPGEELVDLPLDLEPGDFDVGDFLKSRKIWKIMQFYLTNY